MSKKLANYLFPDIKNRSYYDNTKKDSVKYTTRFAPSPTGYIHIGSLYTAFINYIFALINKGTFYIRIEDTDQKRKIKDGNDIILDTLQNFKLLNKKNFKKNYIQSNRTNIYKSYVKYLVEQDIAYPCFLTKDEIKKIRDKQIKNKEEIGIYGKYAKYRNLTFDEIKKNIDENKPFVIRLKANDKPKTIKIKDLVLGNLTFKENNQDIILLKEDLTPTYHLAHIIDDTLMGTTHVIRGDEWVSSLPIHFALYEALNFKPLNYAHISPLTKKVDNKIRKISKRKDIEANIEYFLKLGYPKQALFIYFATLINPDFENWYFQNYDKPIHEFRFEFSKMPKGGTLFDIQKLNFISKFYISKLNKNTFFNEVSKYLKTYDKDFYNIFINNKEYSKNVLNIEREQKNPRKDIKCYSEIKNYYYYMYEELFKKVSYEKNTNINISILKDFINNYNDHDDKETWYQKIKDICSKYNYANNIKEYNHNPEKYVGHIGDVFEYIRYAITKKKQTPDLYEILKILKKDKVKKRIMNFINNI